MPVTNDAPTLMTLHIDRSPAVLPAMPAVAMDLEGPSLYWAPDASLRLRN